MTNIFAQTQTQATEAQSSGDTLRKGFTPLESKVYLATILSAHIKLPAANSNSQSTAVVLSFKLPEEDREYTETLYFKKRDGNIYYEKNGTKLLLPGYENIQDLAKVACNKNLDQLNQINKVLNIYNPDHKKEVPTEVPVLEDLIGKTIYMGIQKIIRRKQKEVNGKYLNTDEQQVINQIDKFFSDRGFTASEMSHNATEPVFIMQWKEAKAGIDVDLFSNTKAEIANTPNPAANPTQPSTPQGNMFQQAANTPVQQPVQVQPQQQPVQQEQPVEQQPTNNNMFTQ